MPDGEIRGRAETEQRLGVPAYGDELQRRSSAPLPEVRVWRALGTLARTCRRRLTRLGRRAG